MVSFDLKRGEGYEISISPAYLVEGLVSWTNQAHVHHGYVRVVVSTPFNTLKLVVWSDFPADVLAWLSSGVCCAMSFCWMLVKHLYGWILRSVSSWCVLGACGGCNMTLSVCCHLIPTPSWLDECTTCFGH